MATKPTPQKPFQITRTRMALCASLLALVLLAGYLLSRPLSPEAIRDRALQALQTKDAEALCRLADPEELVKTHLTPDKVRRMLQDSLWRQNKPQVLSVSLFADKPAESHQPHGRCCRYEGQPCPGRSHREGGGHAEPAIRGYGAVLR